MESIVTYGSDTLTITKLNEDLLRWLQNKVVLPKNVCSHYNQDSPTCIQRQRYSYRNEYANVKNEKTRTETKIHQNIRRIKITRTQMFEVARKK